MGSATTGLDPERRQQLRTARAALGRSSHEPTRRLRQALGVAARRWPAVDDGGWAARIEAERARLLRDEREVSGQKGSTASVATVTRKASSPPAQGWLLFTLARALDARRCLEMGTCVGVSGAYLAAAVALAGGGAVRSLEGHQDRADVARDTWRHLGLEDIEVTVGRFHRTLPEVLAQGPFDLTFVDGHHDGEATLTYTAAIREASRPGALLVLDDIRWSDDMHDAWTRIRDTTRDSAHADLGRLGLILLGPGDAGAS